MVLISKQYHRTKFQCINFRYKAINSIPSCPTTWIRPSKCTTGKETRHGIARWTLLQNLINICIFRDFGKIYPKDTFSRFLLAFQHLSHIAQFMIQIKPQHIENTIFHITEAPVPLGDSEFLYSRSPLLIRKIMPASPVLIICLIIQAFVRCNRTPVQFFKFTERIYKITSVFIVNK